jgi:hypothetical protein
MKIALLCFFIFINNGSHAQDNCAELYAVLDSVHNINKLRAAKYGDSAFLHQEIFPRYEKLQLYGTAASNFFTGFAFFSLAKENVATVQECLKEWAAQKGFYAEPGTANRFTVYENVNKKKRILFCARNFLEAEKIELAISTTW